MNRIKSLTVLLLALSLSFAQNPLGGLGGNRAPNAEGDPFVGSFSDGYNTLMLQGANGSYRGQLIVEGQAAPVTAQGNASGLMGEFTVGSDTYLFTLQLAQNGVVLMVGGEQTLMQRVQAQLPQPMPQPAPMPQPTPQPVPQPTPQPAPQPVPQPAPQPVPAPPPATQALPPSGPWQGTYQLAVYSEANPSQRQPGTLTIEVTPQPNGTYRVASSLDGQPLVDITVTAAGLDAATGQEQFPLPWYTGQTSLYGIPAQTGFSNGMLLFALQQGSSRAQAAYDPNGVLVSYEACENGQCTTMALAR